MGQNYGPWVEYKCFNDCNQLGCPGHRVREVFCRSSDTLRFEVEGREDVWFDVNQWEAMKQAELASREFHK